MALRTNKKVNTPPSPAMLNELLEKNEELQRLSKEKDRFMAMAGHDLQHPLAAIIMLSELLLKKEAEALSAKGRKICTMIYEAAFQMRELLGHYLEASRLDSDSVKLNLSPVNISVVTASVVNRYREIAGRKNISVIFSAPAESILVTDLRAFTQIAENLLSNAVKFTEPYKNVYVSVQDNGSSAVLEIRDEGVGLRRDELPLIFERFASLSSRPTGDELSTGLGLSIVKYLADRLKAAITVKSRKGKGTVITVSFSR